MNISEVCGKLGLTQDALRYYERIGLIPEVNRTKSGIRDYTEEDFRWIKLVICMRGVGLPPEFDSGDGLHISDAAGMRLAEHIPLAILN